VFAASKRGSGLAPGERKLLMIWFHDSRYEWRKESELLPFAANKAELKGGMRDGCICVCVCVGMCVGMCGRQGAVSGLE
jgi:hypothetical protein